MFPPSCKREKVAQMRPSSSDEIPRVPRRARSPQTHHVQQTEKYAIESRDDRDIFEAFVDGDQPFDQGCLGGWSRFAFGLTQAANNDGDSLVLNLLRGVQVFD